MSIRHLFLNCLFAGLGLFVLSGNAWAAKVVVIAGGGTEQANAPATQCKLGSPFAVDFDKSGNLFAVEMVGQRLLKIDASGKLVAVAGTGEKGFNANPGPGLKSALNTPHHLLVAPSGEVLIADTNNNCVRKYDPQSGILGPFAGTGEKGFSGDGGPAIKATFSGVYCLANDTKRQRLLIADMDNRRIRAVNWQSGVISTIAGNGKKGVPADGVAAQESPLVNPRAVAADKEGRIYILERDGNALRIVDGDGKIHTVVGTGAPGNSGDEGDALKATLKGPKHLCAEANGDILIADTDNHVIRRYSPSTGKITLVAGTGKAGAGKEGTDPLQCELNLPHGVAVDAQGDIYIVDSHNDRILKIEKGMTK